MGLRVEAEREALLILTDGWYPGWVARLDGREVPVWRADYAFRGVIVPPGVHRVELSFEPPSFRLGAALTLVGLAGVAGLLGLSGRARPAEGGERSPLEGGEPALDPGPCPPRADRPGIPPGAPRGPDR